MAKAARSSTRGPAPKPTKMKVLQGTARADRMVPNEMTPGTVTLLPKAPDYFDKVAIRIWETATRTLKDLDMLVEVDYAMLAAYCKQMSMVEDCARQIKKQGYLIEYTNNDGATNSIPNPLIKIHNDALAIANRISQQFGFSPSARSRISAPSKKDGDGFDNF